MSRVSQKYFIDLYPAYSQADSSVVEKGKRTELAIRNFLLSNADMVRFTNSPVHRIRWSWKTVFSIHLEGDERDSKFQQMLSKLEPDLIEKFTNNEKYQVTQFENSKINHYLYHLSPRLKELINQETLVWYLRPEPTFFYCLEDPAFYKDNELLGYVITHEHQIFLNLFTEEKKSLEEQGVDFTEAYIEK